MLTDKQFDTAAYRLCHTMGHDPRNPQNLEAAAYDLTLWLKCMQAIDFALKVPR